VKKTETQIRLLPVLPAGIVIHQPTCRIIEAGALRNVVITSGLKRAETHAVNRFRAARHSEIDLIGF
jgi:hypothetical protein